MAEVKKGVMSADELKTQMSELLGINECLDEDIIMEMEKLYLKRAKESGEDKAEEALNLAKRAMSLLKDDEFKGILVTNMLCRLPVTLQMTIINGQKSVITSAMMANLHEKTGEDPIKSLMLMAMAVQSMKE